MREGEQRVKAVEVEEGTELLTERTNSVRLMLMGTGILSY